MSQYSYLYWSLMIQILSGITWRKREPGRWLHQRDKGNWTHWTEDELRKNSTLQGVLHIPTLWRNLISESSLLRAGYRIMKESNKFVISKSNIFIGKGFVCDGFFRLNLINSSNNEISIPIALNIESCDIYHGRLGHVNFYSIKKMINLNLIPKSSFDTSSRCEICI